MGRPGQHPVEHHAGRRVGEGVVDEAVGRRRSAPAAVGASSPRPVSHRLTCQNLLPTAYEGRSPPRRLGPLRPDPMARSGRRAGGLRTAVYGGTMYATTLVDGALEWREHPDPVPGAGQVVVSVAAAGINAADLLQRRGSIPRPRAHPPDIPGMEFAGEVAGLGPGTSRFAAGDRVMSIIGGGAQAELVLVAESNWCRCLTASPGTRPADSPRPSARPRTPCSPRAVWPPGSGCSSPARPGAWERRRCSWPTPPGPRWWPVARSTERHAEVGALGADEVIEPDQVPDHGPYDVSIELVGGAGVAAAAARHGHGRADRGHRRRRHRGQGRAQPAGRDGAPHHHRGVDPAISHAWRRRRPSPAPSRSRPSRCWRRAR